MTTIPQTLEEKGEEADSSYSIWLWLKVAGKRGNKAEIYATLIFPHLKSLDFNALQKIIQLQVI